MGASASVSLASNWDGNLVDLLRIAQHSSSELSTSHPSLSTDLLAVSEPAKLLSLIVAHPALLISFNILVARNRNKYLSNVILQSFFDTGVVNFSDVYSMNTLNIEDGSTNLSSIAKRFMESHKLNTPSAVVGDCQDLSDLDCLREFFANKQFMLSALSVLNNVITGNALELCGMNRSECLLQLCIGGNSLESMSQLTSCMPKSLVSLDVSFTEGIQFTPGVFLSCPQLLHLCLDGCGITTTSFRTNTNDVIYDNAPNELTKECSKSMFFGLVSLITLSIKDNALEDLKSIEGLQAFSLQTSTADNGNGTDSNDSTSLNRTCTLCHVYVADNPLCETSSVHKAFVTYLCAHIPSLCTVDDKPVHNSTSLTSLACVDRSSVAFLRQHALNKQLRENERGAAAVISDAMEAEFTAAIRGEKDNAVVA